MHSHQKIWEQCLRKGFPAFCANHAWKKKAIFCKFIICSFVICVVLSLITLVRHSSNNLQNVEISDSAFKIPNWAHDGEKETSKARILLLTYYRGGSSFLGELFAHNPNAFYWFEPLRGLLGNLYGDENPYKTDVEKVYNLEEQYQKYEDDQRVTELSPESLGPRTDILTDILLCQVYQLPNWTLNDTFLRQGFHMPHMSSYKACLKSLPQPGRKAGMKKCTDLLNSSCNRANVVAVKTIRYPLYAVTKIIEKIPDLKVIYYTRDPRATMASRLQLHKFTPRSFKLFTENLCETMWKNHKYAVNMAKTFPKNILPIRYEDLALKPQITTKKIYDFIGCNVPNDVKNWLKVNTKYNSKSTAFGTSRNSAKTTRNWKHSLGESRKKVAVDVCRQVLKSHGYMGEQ